VRCQVNFSVQKANLLDLYEGLRVRHEATRACRRANGPPRAGGMTYTVTHESAQTV
jgi:hypothetical protein